jgi:hypothetical protein
MLRDDTSPVKVRIKSMSETMSRLAFSACGNTRETLHPPAVDRAVPAHDYWTFLIAQCWNQLARMNIHQLMIGRLETEPRVASFILGLAEECLWRHARNIPSRFRCRAPTLPTISSLTAIR